MIRNYLKNATTAPAKYSFDQSTDGKQIRYQIKTVFGKSFLLIMTTFNPLDYMFFFNAEMTCITEIKQLDSIGKYDDQSGYAIYELHHNIDLNYTLNQISITFKNKFK